MKAEDLFPVGKDEFRTVLRAMEKDEAVLAVKVTEPVPMQASARGSAPECAPLRSRSTWPRACRASCVRVTVSMSIGPVAPGRKDAAT